MTRLTQLVIIQNKAISTISWHDILLHKLEHYGIQGHAYVSQKSYRNNRRQ